MKQSCIFFLRGRFSGRPSSQTRSFSAVTPYRLKPVIRALTAGASSHFLSTPLNSRNSLGSMEARECMTAISLAAGVRRFLPEGKRALSL